MLPPTPTIEIHLAQDEDFSFEIKAIRCSPSPYSPKCPSPMAYNDSDADDFRPVHLVPPPTLSPIAPPRDRPSLPIDKKGIDQARFQELLKATRERPASKFGHHRSNSAELRRQATLKAHSAKAQERRSLFLSKIKQAPSPDAADSPATPPESPAIFHFKLPSPGLQSPLAAYVKMKQQTKQAVAFPAETKCVTTPAPGWVEEVDFKARARTTSIRNGRASAATAKLGLGLPSPIPHVRTHNRRASANALPSLDQITARLVKTSPPQQVNDLAPEIVPVKRAFPSTTLRVAIHRRSPSSPLLTSPVPSQRSVVAKPAPATCDKITPNRLPAFLQKRKESFEAVEKALPVEPKTPTIVVSAPVVVAEKPRINDLALASPHAGRLPEASPRVSGAASRLPPARSRSYPPTKPVTPERRKQTGLDMVEKLRRRSSAPADLTAPCKKDKHPILSMKGGF